LLPPPTQHHSFFRNPLYRKTKWPPKEQILLINKVAIPKITKMATKFGLTAFNGVVQHFPLSECICCSIV